jgi:hypothetical protein
MRTSSDTGDTGDTDDTDDTEWHADGDVGAGSVVDDVDRENVDGAAA